MSNYFALDCIPRQIKSSGGASLRCSQRCCRAAVALGCLSSASRASRQRECWGQKSLMTQHWSSLEYTLWTLCGACLQTLRKRAEAQETILAGDVKTSPPRTAPKKQLPSVPKSALPVRKPACPTPAARSANGTHASYGPFYLEYSLLAEFTLVVKQKLPGVYVQPSYRSALVWFGVIFIRHGLYQDGVFKFTVYIPDNYPDGDCPRLLFDIPIFHPLVDSTSGELDVKRAFAKWKRNHNHIWQVLMYARRVFYKIDTTSPLNPEAAVLYEKDVQFFKSKVVDSVILLVCLTSPK